MLINLLTPIVNAQVIMLLLFDLRYRLDILLFDLYTGLDMLLLLIYSSL